MKKSAAEDVYLLINSLNSSERSHFKKSLSKRSDGKLADVFDLIAKQKSFNADEMRSKIGLLYTNHSEAYRQLTSAVLKSLTAYHSNKSAIAELNTLLSQIAITREKKLFALCENLIQKGLKIANDNSLFNYQGLLWSWKSKLPPEPPKTPVEWQNEAHDQMKLASKLVQRSVNQSFLHYKLGQFAQTENITRSGLQQFFDEIISHELLRENDGVPSGSKMLDVHGQNVINGAYFFYGDLQKALNGCNKLIQMLGAVKQLPDRMYYNWAAIHGNMLELSGRLYNHAAFQAARERLVESVKLRNGRPEDIAHTNLSLADVKHEVNSDNLDKALTELGSLIENKNASEYGLTGQKQLVRLNILWVLFLQEKYAEALASINTFLTDKDYRSDNQRVLETRWLEVLCTYSLNDLELFESRMLSFKRFLKTLDSGFDWETEILSVLETCFSLTDNATAKKFELLHAKIIPLQFEFNATLPGVDLLSWVESKAKGQNLSQLIRAKYLG